MKCYNHHDRDAFGVCQICGKGLCLECMDKDSEFVVCSKGHGRKILSDKVLNWLFILVGVICFVMLFEDFDVIKVFLGILALCIGFDGLRKSKKKQK